MTAFYLRFTTDPENDLGRGTSYHALYEGECEDGAAKDRYGFAITEIDGEKVSVIGGLCGYELRADNLEDAINEARSGSGGWNGDTFGYADINSDSWAIFEGEDPRIQNHFGDGDIFRPLRVAHKERC